MEINQIKYLLKVMETKNFSKAADQLFITQPTLSQQIAKLEDELDVVFIDRTTRAFSITKAGEEFCAYAKELMKNWNKLYSEMTKYQKNKKSSIKIGIFPTLAKIGMTNPILSFTNENPNTKIELIESYSEHLYSMVISKKVDLAIVNKIEYPIYDKSLKLAAFPLVNDRIVLLCGAKHPLANEPSVSLQKALEYPVVKLSPHSSVSKIMNVQYQKQNLKPTVACECENTSNMISIVDEGYGVSFLSSTVANHYATEKTRMIKIVPKIKNTAAIITLKKNLNSKLVEDFIEYLLAFAHNQDENHENFPKSR